MMPDSISLLFSMIIVPLLGMVFALIAKDSEEYKNSSSVTLFVILFNIFLIIKSFLMIDIDSDALQLTEQFRWMRYPNINIAFGVDVMSLMIMLAIHMALVIGVIGTWGTTANPKPMMVWTCMFLAMINGFFVAADIFSFYIFFEAMLLPVFMLVSMFGEVKKEKNIFRFAIYNIFGALFLFVAVIVIHNSVPSSVLLKDVGNIINSEHRFEVLVWICVFIAFVSRIPIWPFHYWIAAVNSNIKNPLVFIIANIVPLTAVYGFVQFLPVNMPTSVSYFATVLMFVALISMIFIALIGLAAKEISYKVFSYMTVYYILYLLAALLKDGIIILNVSFSLFAFLITCAAMISVFGYIEKESEKNNVPLGGILCATPRTYVVLSFLTLAAIGLPVSSFFLNNFVIVSKIMEYNIWFGIMAIVSMLIAAAVFVQELYRMRDHRQIDEGTICIMDMSKKFFWLMLLVALILFMSFLNPLWFTQMGG